MQSPDSPGRIACIGEAMVELTGIADNAQRVGLGFAGDTLNTAIYLKRLLGIAGDVAYVTVLGHDSFSARMIRFIERESIDTTCIRRSTDRQVGLYAIDTDTKGERTFSYWRSQSAARTLFQGADGSTDFDVLAGFDVLYLSAITMAILPADIRTELIASLASLRQRGTIIAFDSNYRPALWESQTQARQTITDAWRVTDIALPSLDDEMDLFADRSEAAVLQRLHSYGVRRGAIKRGARGPASLDPANHQASAADQPAIDVVDTTAAGDSFNAGYLSRALTGNEADAMHTGHQLASRVIGYPGAIIPLDEW